MSHKPGITNAPSASMTRPATGGTALSGTIDTMRPPPIVRRVSRAIAPSLTSTTWTWRNTSVSRVDESEDWWPAPAAMDTADRPRTRDSRAALNPRSLSLFVSQGDGRIDRDGYRPD